MLLERWTGIRHRIGIGTASTPTKGSLGVLVTQAQHTLGKLSLWVVCETAQTLRGILCFGAMPPFSFFFFGALWLFLILEPALAGCPHCSGNLGSCTLNRNEALGLGTSTFSEIFDETVVRGRVTYS